MALHHLSNKPAFLRRSFLELDLFRDDLAGKNFAMNFDLFEVMDSLDLKSHFCLK